DLASLRRPLPWTTEEQDVAVGIANLEAPKTVACVFERHAKCDAMVGEFGGQRIRIGDIDEGIQPQVGMTSGVRQRHYVSFGFDKDLGAVAADDGEKRILLRLAESGFKAELVAVKSDGSLDVGDNEGRRNCRSGCSRHK